MANPRQRRKSKSSSHKPVSHSKHAKRNLKKMPPIRGATILQSAWDKAKTVRQNYAALGLVHDLNPTDSGGAEATQSDARVPNSDQLIAAPAERTPGASNIPSGYGKLLRDDTGDIVGVQLSMDDDNAPAGVIGQLNEVQVEPDALSKWADNTQKRNDVDGVVAGLEQIAAPITGTHNLAASISGVGARHSSSGEVEYLARLVKAYGHDLEAMAKGHKLNYEQRTSGQLRRALKRAGFET